jgi:hypothetical protein
MRPLRSYLLFAVFSLGTFQLCCFQPCVAADTPWCKTADLKLKPLMGTAAGGTLDATYAFQNHSAKSCVLGGYPSLRALDKKGKPIRGVEFKRMPDISGLPEQPLIPSRIVLNPGEEVWFQLVFTSEGGYHGDVEDRSMCHRMETLLVTPPGNRKPLVTEFSGESCNLRYTPVFLPIPGWREPMKEAAMAKQPIVIAKGSGICRSAACYLNSKTTDRAAFVPALVMVWTTGLFQVMAPALICIAVSAPSCVFVLRSPSVSGTSRKLPA